MEDFSQFPVTMFLILANCAASFVAFTSPGFMNQNLFHVGPILKRHEWHRILTSGFLHGGMLHLFVNMYVLYSFGSLLEVHFFGPAKFAIVYFAGLIGGNLWSLLENRNRLDYRALGASGATSAVILSFCLFAPFATLGFFFIPMPAVVFAIIFIVGSAFLAQRENKVIGHEAHLGGALAGILATIAVEPRALSIFSEQIARFLGGA